MNILQIATVDIGGGAESSAWNLFHAFRSRGHNSWLAVGSKRSADPDVLLINNEGHQNLWTKSWLAADRVLGRLRGKVRGVDHLRNMLRWVGQPRRLATELYGYEDFYFPGTWHLLNLVPNLPDIVHCHNLHGGYFDLRILPWLSSCVPVVLNLRDAWLLSGHCSHSLGCARWKIGCGKCPNLNVYPSIKRDATSYNWRRKRNIFQKSRLYITTPSQWLMNKVKASMLEGVGHRVIPNGIDLTIFKPGNKIEARRTLHLPDNAKIILLIAHNEFKDYDTMEAALGQLDKNGNSELIFVCLGKTGADKIVGQGKMVYRGFERSPNRMALYYRASDVFVHAARDEAFGKTVAEAMASGVPVAATAVGGIAEQIEDGRTGFLVLDGDSKTMADATRWLLKDSNLSSSLREAALKVARERFGLEHQVTMFLNWYKEIMEDWKNRK